MCGLTPGPQRFEDLEIILLICRWSSLLSPSSSSEVFFCWKKSISLIGGCAEWSSSELTSMVCGRRRKSPLRCKNVNSSRRCFSMTCCRAWNGVWKRNEERGEESGCVGLFNWSIYCSRKSCWGSNEEKLINWGPQRKRETSKVHPLPPRGWYVTV